jgi:small subunit ribosomal protein S19
METRKKEFTFKGKTVEELKKLDVREFSKYVPSRRRRTILRQFQEIEKFLNRTNEKLAKKKHVKTHQRSLIIVPEMVGMRIQIYNGQVFVPVDVVGEMLGHAFGEFAPTRTRTKHGKAGVGATKGSKAKSKK